MKQPQSGHANAGACPPGAVPERTLYFARVPPTIPAEDIIALFETCGPVRDLQLYRPWCNARSSKGCGLVEYQEAGGAQAALAHLNGTTPWPSAFSPLLVEPLAPHKVHKKPHGQQHHKAARAQPNQRMAPPPLPPTTSGAPAAAAAPAAALSSGLALGCTSGALGTMPGTTTALLRCSSSSSSTSSSSGCFTDRRAGGQEVMLAPGSPVTQSEMFASKALPAVGGGAWLGLVAPSVAMHTTGGSRSSSTSLLHQAAGSTADDTDTGCTSSANNSSNSNAFVVPVLPAAAPPMLTGSNLIPGQIGEESYLSTSKPPIPLVGGTALGPGASAGAALMTGDAAPPVALAGPVAMCTSTAEACVSSRGLAAGAGVGLGRATVQNIQQQLPALRGEFGAARAGMGAPGETALEAEVLLATSAAPVGGQGHGSWTMMDLEGLRGPRCGLASAPALTVPLPVLALPVPAAPEPAPAAGVDGAGGPVGRVAMSCQQRVQLRVSLQQAEQLAHHATSLAQVTGASVAFVTTTDGGVALTLEGSIAQVVQAQNLAMLLL